MWRALTLPFFREQVNFRQKNLREKARYMLFFVTEVVRLRRDGMEPSIIVERLVDQGVGLEDLTVDQAVADITKYFDGRVKDGELRYHRRGDDPHAAYGFVDNAVERYWSELNKQLRVVMTYAQTIQGRARRVAEILMETGVIPWQAAIMEKGIIRSAAHQYLEHEEAVNDACAVACLITAEFKYEGMNKHVIDFALRKLAKTTQERFTIIPIIVLGQDEKPEPRLIEERVPQPLRDAKLACHWAGDDADVIGHIIRFMPVRLGVIGWRSA